MTGWQPFFTMALIVGAMSGCYIWARNKASKDHEVSEKEETKRTETSLDVAKTAIHVLQTVADKNPQLYAQYERPIKTLVKSMDKGDTITIGKLEDKIPAEIAVKCGPKCMPRSEEQTTYCDGNYTVLDKRYDEGEFVIATHSSQPCAGYNVIFAHKL